MWGKGDPFFHNEKKLFFFMFNNKNIRSDLLIVQLTVEEMKTIVKEVLLDVMLSSTEKSGVLTIEEVSELTGYKKSTLYKLTHERKIPFHKPAHGGRRIFFKREEINWWMQSNRVETHEEYFEKLKIKENGYEKNNKKNR